MMTSAKAIAPASPTWIPLMSSSVKFVRDPLDKATEKGCTPWCLYTSDDIMRHLRTIPPNHEFICLCVSTHGKRAGILEGRLNINRRRMRE
jgi:hypothetical protein